MASGSGVRFLGNRVSYRNAYTRAAVEEIRAIVAKATASANLMVQKSLRESCQEFVEYYGTSHIFPVDTGNLLDSFGVGIYKGDTLLNLFMNPQTAQKYVRTGFTAAAPVGTIMTKFGNIRDIISGRRELEAMAEAANINQTVKLNKAGLKTSNFIMAIMYVAAPYARSVHEKGYAFGSGPINQYYIALEYNFEHDLLRRLQDMYPNARGTTQYREMHR